MLAVELVDGDNDKLTLDGDGDDAGGCGGGGGGVVIDGVIVDDVVDHDDDDFDVKLSIPLLNLLAMLRL